jgi:hypothetical protein
MNRDEIRALYPDEWDYVFKHETPEYKRATAKNLRQKHEKNISFEEEQESLFEFLAHGDTEHRGWLREAIRAWYEGKERPE